MAEELDDGLAMQSLLLDELGQSVIGMDSRWRITYWNRASELLYGFTASEAVGAAITDLGIVYGDGPHGAGVSREIAHRIATGGVWSGELWVSHRTGREFPVHATVSPVRGRHTFPVAAVAISKDITDRKHNEAVLRRFSAVIESSGDAIISADMAGTITSWNSGATRMFGWTAREAVGQSYRLLTTHDRKAFHEKVKASLISGRFVTGLAVRWGRKDGLVIDVELTVSPVYGPDGEQAGVSAIARDITEIQRLRAAAAVEREKLLAAQEMAHVGSVEHTKATGEIWHSEEFGRIFGIGRGQLASRELMLELTHPEDRERVQRVWKDLDEGAAFADFEYRILRPDGEQRWLHSRIRNVEADGRKPGRFLDTVLDITERKQAEQILEWQARHDPLTGLPNRYVITEMLQELLDRDARVVVMFIDVDRFKLINDGIGHGAGDTILTQLGERLKSFVRTGETVGRFGGDEFVVVSGNMMLRGARTLAERIRQSTRRPFDVDGRKIYLNVSVGIALAGPDDTAESVLQGADAAMYRAKSAGGDSSAVYDVVMSGTAAGRLNLESDLRLALERRELSLNYQPIIDIVTGKTIGFEALLRWQHPEHGPIGPDTFIPIAEETGLIVPIGTWVLREALRQVQQWRTGLKGAEGVSAAVNISGRQFLAPDFTDIVEAAIRDAGIAAGAVDLEITETVLVDQPDLPKATLQQLHTLGVGLSIDDFGTGYSSLSYLRWLSARTLKIDRTFVDELGRGPHGATIIELVLGMAESLSLTVVAEGVETAEQLAELRRLGIRYAQGFYWSPPLPPEEIPAWLETPFADPVGDAVPAR